MATKIRSATRNDVPVICRFVTNLAEYEKLLDEVHFTAPLYRQHLFDTPTDFRPEVLIAETNTYDPAGFALYIQISGSAVYLEDLFVDPVLRGKGIGIAILAHLAEVAVKRGVTELQWNCLDWNKSSIDFYESLGAVQVPNHLAYRISGDSLDKSVGIIELSEFKIKRGIDGENSQVLVTHIPTKVSIEFSLSFTTFNGTPVIYVTDVSPKNESIPDNLIRYLIREAQVNEYSRVDICLDPTSQRQTVLRLITEFGAIEMVGWIPFRLRGEALYELAKRTSSV